MSDPCCTTGAVSSIDRHTDETGCGLARMHRLLASRATLWGCDGSAGGVRADWTSVERRPTSQRAATGPRSSHGSVHSGSARTDIPRVFWEIEVGLQLGCLVQGVLDGDGQGAHWADTEDSGG